MLSARNTLVVGASSGIGLAVARTGLARGATVWLASRDASRLAKATSDLRGDYRLLPLDMLDPSSVETAVAHIEAIDYLVLTAVADELSRRAPIVEVTEDQIERSFDKLRGYAHVVRAAAPRLSADASLVLLCGASAIKPPRGFSLLAAESSAIPGFARGLAVDLAPRRVNVVMAGVVDTPIHAHHRDELESWARTSLPVHRLGTADDIADAVWSLLTNPYVTGHTLVADGGLQLL